MAIAMLQQLRDLVLDRQPDVVEDNLPSSPSAERTITRSVSLPASLFESTPVFHVEEAPPASATAYSAVVTLLEARAASTETASGQLQTLPSKLTGLREPDIHNPDTCPVCQIFKNYGIGDGCRSTAEADCPVCGEAKPLHYVVRYLEVEQVVKPLVCDHAFCQDCLVQWYGPKIKAGALRLQCAESGCKAQLGLDDVHALDVLLADHFRATQQASYNVRETSEFTDLMKQNEIVPCPGCQSLIQRSEGCNAMVCSQCLCEFCYECGGEFVVPEYTCGCGQ